jgi:hypothetical protein
MSFCAVLVCFFLFLRTEESIGRDLKVCLLGACTVITRSLPGQTFFEKGCRCAAVGSDDVPFHANPEF